MSRCKHNRGNIQQFTEICLDCGRNIYESDDEYEKSLFSEIQSLKKKQQEQRISDLEKLRDELKKKIEEKEDEYHYDDRF